MCRFNSEVSCLRSQTEKGLEMLERLVELIEGKRAELRRLSDDIWSHPEILLKEKYAVQRCKEYLNS